MSTSVADRTSSSWLLGLLKYFLNVRNNDS